MLQKLETFLTTSTNQSLNGTIINQRDMFKVRYMGQIMTTFLQK